ncbi:Putative phage Rnase [Bacillus subtilis]|nr:Putative phage Rnase [Bacillus subtilis]
MTDPDEYLEIAKKVGYENLTHEQLEFVSFLEQRKALLDNGKEVLQIISDGAKGAIVGVYDLAKDTGEGAIQRGCIYTDALCYLLGRKSSVIERWKVLCLNRLERSC